MHNHAEAAVRLPPQTIPVLWFFHARVLLPYALVQGVHGVLGLRHRVRTLGRRPFLLFPMPKAPI